MIRKWLTGLIAGLAVQPAMRTATSRDDREREPVRAEQGEYDEILYDCRVGNLARTTYSGPMIPLNGTFVWPGKIVSRGGNWTNSCLAGAREFETFVQSRTR